MSGRAESQADAGAGPRSAGTLPSEIWVLIGAAFVIAIGFGLVAPVLPQFARSFGVGVAAASAIVSAFALMRLLFAPVSGRLVQRLGERWVYLSGLVIVAVSTGASALAQTYWQLLALRSVGGIGSTMFTVSSLALVIRLSPPEQRGRVSGLWSTSFLVGSVSGPLVGGALAGLGLRAPFLIYAAALLAVSAAVYLSLRHSHLAAPEVSGELRVMTFRQALARPAYRAVLWSNFANGAAIFGVRMALVPLLVVEVLQQPAGMAGVALTAFAAGNVAVLFLSGRLSDRWGRKPFLVVGSLVCALGTAGLGYAPNFGWLLVTSVVAGLGSGMLTPTQQAALADILGPKARGGPVLAGFQMAADLGTVLGPIAVGALAQHTSYGPALAVTGALLAIAAAAWLVVPETLRGHTAEVETDHVAAVPCDDAEYQLAHRAADECEEARGQTHEERSPSPTGARR
ncbi:putative arabinose efflux permease, MFS family [Nocardia amikacinitolerans]|uniref:MFS transporter n=1 Tax=Nocardia amikacinitolerans TaxID=756689 RepID=UPI000A02F89B|nr:MFS transporter [Nocardia amikacinitolerans]MCP2321280.1 putative arabinose efflux permease, MFS family [Nocardia amikacinitolerans]